MTSPSYQLDSRSAHCHHCALHAHKDNSANLAWYCTKIMYIYIYRHIIVGK